MVEKSTIVKEELKYKGLGDFKDVYEYAYNWLKDEDFVITERKYEEINKGDAKEIRFWWEVNKKVTDYFRISLDMKWQILNMREVEVEINGKRKKMNEFGELKIVIKGVLEKDYSSKWGLKGFNKFLREIYDKYVIPTRTEEMEIKVSEVVQQFKDEIKAFLDLTGKRK